MSLCDIIVSEPLKAQEKKDITRWILYNKPSSIVFGNANTMWYGYQNAERKFYMESLENIWETYFMNRQNKKSVRSKKGI